MAKFLNPSLPSKVLWKNLNLVGATEDDLDTAPIIFSPDELRLTYPMVKSNAVDLDEIPLKFVKLLLSMILLPLTHIFYE
jgi:hypothetical protein